MTPPDLDPDALERAAQALCIALGSACPIPLYSDHHKVAEKIVTAYLTAREPGVTGKGEG